MAPSAPDETTTVDAFLNGRVMLEQPRLGYRAATDPVLLAAACAARPGERVLDAGCGVGAAALCLLARVADLDLHGIDIEETLVAVARRNAVRNGTALHVHHGDLDRPPAAIKAMIFDHVITNPPFFAPTDPASPVALRDAARREGGLALAGWLRACLRRLKQGGTLTVIHRAAQLPRILDALDGRAGTISVRPLAARTGRAAQRVLVRAIKDRRGPFTLTAPLVLHDGLSHGNDGDDFSAAARAILRCAAPLPFDDTEKQPRGAGDAVQHSER